MFAGGRGAGTRGEEGPERPPTTSRDPRDHLRGHPVPLHWASRPAVTGCLPGSERKPQKGHPEQHRPVASTLQLLSAEIVQPPGLLCEVCPLSPPPWASLELRGTRPCSASSLSDIPSLPGTGLG